MLGSRNSDLDDNKVKRIKLDLESDSRLGSLRDGKAENVFSIKLESNGDNVLADFDEYNGFSKSETVDSYDLFQQSQFHLNKDDSVSNDIFPVFDGESDSCEQSEDPDTLKALRIKTVLEKELQSELSLAKEDLETIEDRIFEVRQCLIKIRHTVVSEFYEQKKSVKARKPLHPAVRTVVSGKTPACSSAVPDEVNLPTRRSARTRNKRSVLDRLEEDKSVKSEDDINVTDDDLSDRFSKDKTDIDCSDSSKIHLNSNGRQNDEIELNMRLPRYVPPKPFHKPVANLHEPRANVTKQKIRLTVGNVSKWLGTDSPDKATHKWTVYIKSSQSELDLSKIIHRAKYYLHPSYKPNDVVVVTHPFKLTRRGWGEFPLRICLEFINKSDKAVDIYHNLKLDRSFTGMETFGGETLVDVWVHLEQDKREKPSQVQSSESDKSMDAVYTDDDCEQMNIDIGNVHDFSLFIDRKVKCEPLERPILSPSVSSTSIINDTDFESADKNCEEVLIDFDYSSEGFSADKSSFEVSHTFVRLFLFPHFYFIHLLNKRAMNQQPTWILILV